MKQMVKLGDEKDRELQDNISQSQKERAMSTFSHVLLRWRYCDHMRALGTWREEALY